MGEILDSTGVANISTVAYKQRASDFVNRFGNRVDLWEIGNEVNGEWLGDPATIRAKIQAAYDVVEKEHSGLRSVLTLNYWPSSDCYSQSWEATTTFANSLAAEIKTGIDYVLLSFYESSCSPAAHPSLAQFTSILNSVKTIFPNAKVGLGELGTENANAQLSEKVRVATTYYGMFAALKSAVGPRFVGGGFWWYFYQNAVPYNKTNSIWPTLNTVFNSY